ncbi:hypothetical protein WJX74_008514 [Apatococcus lobatus]
MATQLELTLEAGLAAVPAVSCRCLDEQPSLCLLSDEADVVLSPFSKPALREMPGETSCSHPCFADELERECLELERLQKPKPRSSDAKAFSVASSFGSAQTGKLSCKLQGHGSGSFQGSQCGLPVEGSSSLRPFSATAECHLGRAGLRRKQPLAVALENVRRLRLHGVASRPGAWQGCSKNPECNREDRHRGLCNRRATIAGLSSYPDSDVLKTAIAMGMPLTSIAVVPSAGQEHLSDLESPEGSVQGSDRSDHTQLGLAVSCNGDDQLEDQESEGQQGLVSEQEDDSEADIPQPYHSDDESGAGGVSSGVSISDCDSPNLGLLAFDSPLQDDQECQNDRSEADIPTLVSPEYDAGGLNVCGQPVPGEVFADDLGHGIEYGCQELPLTWHCPPSDSFLPGSPELSMGSRASAEADDEEPSEPSEPFSDAYAEEQSLTTSIVSEPRLQVPRPRASSCLREAPAKPAGSRKNKRPIEFNTEGPAYPGQQCTQCSTQSTPVWRAGPLGPKTLCNACGVRYMKVAKRTR